jgi:hypothetical protein
MEEGEIEHTWQRMAGKWKEGAGVLTYLLRTKKRITLTKSITKGVIMEDLNLCGRDWKGGY